MNPAELFRQETNTVKLAPGDFLYREGERGDKMYVLLEGEIDVRLGNCVVETAREGALIGEIALIENSPRGCQRPGEDHLPTGGNRSTAVSVSCSAAPAFCDSCDENAG
jgi:CRP-like cAMP-binding protein